MEYDEEIEEAGPRVTGIEVGGRDRNGHSFQHIQATGYARIHNGDVIVSGGGDYIYNERSTDPDLVAAAVVRQLVDEGTIVQLAGLMQRAQASNTPIHEARNAPSSRPHYQFPRPGNKGRSRKWSLTLRPWMVSHIWQASVNRSYAGWDASIRTWNIVPFRSAIMEMARRGDVRGIQKLVDCGQASPFDVDELGYNIAMVAALYSGLYPGVSSAVTRYFLDSTHSDPGELLKVDIRSADPLDVEGGWYETLIHDFGADSSDLMDPGPPPLWWCMLQRIESVNIVFQSLPFAYSSLSPGERLSKALAIRDPNLSLFIAATGYEADPGGLATATTPCYGETAIHVIARRFDPNSSERDEYCTFLKRLVQNGAHLHALQWDAWVDIYKTPFMKLLERDIQRVGSWLDLLVSAGVDLEGYGRKEFEIWSSESAYRPITAGVNACPRRRRFHEDLDRSYTVVGFDYGSSPSDWRLIVQPSVTIPIYTSISVPGSWVDECVGEKICWMPSSDDESHTFWAKEDTVRMHYRERVLPNQDLWEPPPAPKSDQGTYDDASPSVLMLLRPRAWTCLRKRGQSQPPMDRMAKHRCLGAEASLRRDHRSGLHWCNLTSKSALHFQNYFFTDEDARECVRGRREDHADYWQRHSIKFEGIKPGDYFNTSRARKQIRMVRLVSVIAGGIAL